MHLNDLQIFIALVTGIDKSQGESVKDVKTAVLIKRCFTMLEKFLHSSEYFSYRIVVMCSW